MRDIRKDDAGSVAIMSVFSIMVLLMISALALETSSLYVEKLRTQRAADIANLAAANTPSPIVRTAPSAIALATARQMAVVNGFQPGEVETTVTAGASGVPELSTRILHQSPLDFGQILTDKRTVPVGGSSSARVVAEGTGDCIRSLFGATSIYDRAVVDGPGCTIAAATYLNLCGTPLVAARKVEVGTSRDVQTIFVCSQGLIDPPLSSFSFDTPSVDPLAADPRILAIKSRLQGMTNWAYGTTIPKSPLTLEIAFGGDETYSGATVSLPGTRRYGRLSISNSTIAITARGAPDPTCRYPTTISGDVVLSGTNQLTFGSGCYAIGGSLLNGSGAVTRFDPLPGASVMLVVIGKIDNAPATLSFGHMGFSILGDVSNAEHGKLTFGNGPFRIGGGITNQSGTLRFGDGPYYVAGGTISNAGSLTFGNGAFYLWGGSLTNTHAGSTTFGNGPFYLYGGTVTNSSGRLTFGDGPFEFSGGSLTLSPGSETVFGVGDLNFYGGSATFEGSSIVVGRDRTGDAQRGSSSAFFYGGSYSFKSEALTAVGTTFAFYGGSVSLHGVGTMAMTAPTASTPTFGYRNILFYIYGGAFSLYQGNVRDLLSGVIYAPGSNISIYGGQSVEIPEAGCLQLIGGFVDIYQNASLKTRSCSLSGTAARTVSLTR